jgi:ubiquinone/menaquinone biosynthesis C-methylase UbiE
VTQAANHKAYIAGVFDRAAPSYDQTGVDFFRRAGAALVDAAGLRPGDRVLDVGCGRGASLFPAAAAVGADGSVTGVDLAPRMVSETRAEVERRGLTNVAVELGDAEAPDFPDGSFDAVLAGLVLFFLPDAAAAVQAYARLLRPGGRLAFSTFQEMSDEDQASRQRIVAGLSGFWPQGAAAPVFGAPPETRLRTRQSIADLLAPAGFVDLVHAEHEVPLSFATADQYWEWMWSQGMRAMLERIPTDRLDAARQVIANEMEGLRDQQGVITLRMRIRITTAECSIPLRSGHP